MQRADPNQLFARAKHIENEMMNMDWEHNAPSVYENEKGADFSVMELGEEETGSPAPSERPTHLLNAILVGFTLFLITVMLGAGFRQIAIEVVVDKNWLRLAFILLTPVQIFFTLVRSPLHVSVERMSSIPLTLRTSSSPKSLSEASHNVSDPFSKCGPTPSTTPPSAHNS